MTDFLATRHTYFDAYIEKREGRNKTAQTTLIPLVDHSCAHSTAYILKKSNTIGIMNQGIQSTNRYYLLNKKYTNIII